MQGKSAVSANLNLRPEAYNAGAKIVAMHDPQSSRAADLRRVAQTLALRWFKAPGGNAALSIISAERGEGRSTVAANLACIFASSGMSVLLIDADMHAPSLHTMFSLAPESPLQGSCQRVDGFANLCLVPASQIESSGQTRFIDKPIQALIELHRPAFSAIFVDTPAVSISSDYLVASLASGGALVVTREGLTRARLAIKMLNECDDAGIPVVGGVMLKT